MSAKLKKSQTGVLVQCMRLVSNILARLLVETFDFDMFYRISNSDLDYFAAKIHLYRHRHADWRYVQIRIRNVYWLNKTSSEHNMHYLQYNSMPKIPFLYLIYVETLIAKAPPWSFFKYGSLFVSYGHISRCDVACNCWRSSWKICDLYQYVMWISP